MKTRAALLGRRGRGRGLYFCRHGRRGSKRRKRNLAHFELPQGRNEPEPRSQGCKLEGLGDQRSSLAYSEQTGRIYFTTKGGYLCSAKVDGTTGTLTELKTCLPQHGKHEHAGLL